MGDEEEVGEEEGEILEEESKRGGSKGEGRGLLLLTLSRKEVSTRRDRSGGREKQRNERAWVNKRWLWRGSRRATQQGGARLSFSDLVRRGLAWHSIERKRKRKKKQSEIRMYVEASRDAPDSSRKGTQHTKKKGGKSSRRKRERERTKLKSYSKIREQKE